MRYVTIGRIIVVIFYVTFILLSYALVNSYVKATQGDESYSNTITSIVLTLIFLMLLIYVLSNRGLIP